MPCLKNLLRYLKIIIFLGSLHTLVCAVFVIVSGQSLEAFSLFSRSPQLKNTKTFVRVLLDTQKLPLKSSIAISTIGLHMSIHTEKRKPLVVNSNHISISVRRGALVLQGAPYAASAELSADDNIVYAGKMYHGTIRLLVQGDSLLIINYVPLEQYVSSVLKTESWPGWPLEVNKAFAITSRTYVLYMMQEAQKVGRLYDVHNTKKHQTYSGVHDTKILQDAVTQTQGMVLMYHGKPILAMFDSCCGGVIPARMHGVDFENAPYLARTYPCMHCKSLWIYNWRAVFTTKQLADSLFKNEQTKFPIRSIRITKKDPAGLITEVEIEFRKKKCLTGKELYHTLKEVKSFVYTIKKDNDTIIFSGRGYGHHLGLCQWGAREMVRAGWSYKRILQFYYPGVQMARMSC